MVIWISVSLKRDVLHPKVGLPKRYEQSPMRPNCSTPLAAESVPRKDCARASPEAPCQEIDGWWSCEHGLLMHSFRERAGRDVTGGPAGPLLERGPLKRGLVNQDSPWLPGVG
jgi:hypothetical protein